MTRAAARHRADDPRAGGVPRLRGDLEGADDAAHPAHVGDELHPRHRHRRARSSSSASRTTRSRRSSASSRWCSRPRTSSAAGSSPTACSRCSSGGRSRSGRTRVISDPDVLGLLYLVTIVCFVLALRFLSSPRHARRGNWLGGAGMLVAIATTLLIDGIANWALIVVAAGDRERRRRRSARGNVQMTAMPQMVALFNGVGGGAAALVALAELHELDGVLVWDESALDRALGADRLDLLRGLARRVREAAGARQRAADRLPGAERRERARPRRRGRARESRSSRGSRGSGRSPRSSCSRSSSE